MTFRARYGRFLKAIEEQEIDGFLTSQRANIRYLFNLDASIAFAVTWEGETTLLVDSRYFEAASRVAVNCRVELSSTAPETGLQEFLWQGPGKQRGRLGFEADHLTYGLVTSLESGGFELTLVATSLLVERLRQVKDRDELAEIRRAFQTAATGYRAVFADFAWKGTESDLAGRLDYELRKAGAEGPAFETIVAADARSSLPHARPTPTPFDDCSLLLVDFGAVIGGYHSDATRVHLRQGANRCEELKIVREAQARAISQIRPGVPADRIDALARNYIAERGHAEHFGHGLGHGLGLQIHELPRIHTDSKELLEAGMVFTVEPGIYLPGRYGVRWEDAVIVTESGCEVLRIDS